MVAAWNFILIAICNTTDKKKCELNESNENFRKSAIVISWIVFAVSCLGTFMALLEMIGVLHATYKLNVILDTHLLIIHH